MRLNFNHSNSNCVATIKRTEKKEVVFMIDYQFIIICERSEISEHYENIPLFWCSQLELIILSRWPVPETSSMMSKQSTQHSWCLYLLSLSIPSRISSKLVPQQLRIRRFVHAVYAQIFDVNKFDKFTANNTYLPSVQHKYLLSSDYHLCHQKQAELLNQLSNGADV
jgi:hypothetical protein